MRFRCLIPCLLLVLCAGPSVADEGEKPLRIFGYFQNSLQRWTEFEERRPQNSFSLQQLNLLLQKDISSTWVAFLNFEFLNNFSSKDMWGSARLEEAWVRYRKSEQFNLKLGLQIPIFNDLNEINNRTPLLPYITRPLVYESSFSDFLPVDEFVPPTAFVQGYGFLPVGELKVDYALYVGNTSGLNDDPDKGQTGIDTTEAFLVGGRLGVRINELKAGLSGTHEKSNGLTAFSHNRVEITDDLTDRPKFRYGGDFSYAYRRWLFNSEYISANFDEGTPRLEVDLDFYYVTLGYSLTEQTHLYATYWDTESHILDLDSEQHDEENEEIQVYSTGVSFGISDRIRLKAQVARVITSEMRRTRAQNLVEKERDNFSVSSVAVSTLF
jgi:hypothetical protein